MVAVVVVVTANYLSDIVHNVSQPGSGGLR